MGEQTVDRLRGSVPRLDHPSLWQRIWRPFWVLPFVIVFAALVLSWVLPWLDRTISHEIPFVFQGGPDGARGLLSTIASAMISVTGLVFSITMVVLQLAQSQFTPRLLDSFLADRTTQATLGVFTASFVYSLAVLRTVRGSNEDIEEFVPQLSVTAAFLLVLGAVAMFIAFIHNITTTVQVTTVVNRVGRRTAHLVDEQFGPPDDIPGFGPTWSPRPDEESVPLVVRGRHGSLDHVDYPRLVALARDNDVVVHLGVHLGSFIASGHRVGTVWGTAELDEELRQGLDRTLGIARTRTTIQDISFGVRQLVDIAERALSPGINDPTTAIQVLDEIHVILRELAVRRTISPYIVDESGEVRVVTQPPSFAGILDLALDEVIDYADNVQVPRKLEELLEDVGDVARPENRAAVVAKLEELRERAGPA